MGNYMAITCEKEKDFNTNYHELVMNLLAQQNYMNNYMAIICEKTLHELVMNLLAQPKLMVNYMVITC